jgi:hypothetical protein
MQTANGGMKGAGRSILLEEHRRSVFAAGRFHAGNNSITLGRGGASWASACSAIS